MEFRRFSEDDGSQQKAKSQLQCVICKLVVVEPHTCYQQHLFCKSCIEHHMESQPTCPVDSHDISHKSFICPSKIHESFLQCLTVQCTNRSLSSTKSRTESKPKFKSRKRQRMHKTCTWAGKICDLKEHERNCPLRKIKCEQCSQMISHVLLTPHKLSSCPNIFLNCQLCDIEIKKCDLQSHYNTCPNANVTCPNMCTFQPQADIFILPRKHLEHHLKVCPNRIEKCEFHHLGCLFVGTVNNVQSHEQTDMHSHLSLLAKCFIDLQSVVKTIADIPNSKTLVGVPNSKTLVDVPNSKTLVDVPNSKTLVDVPNSKILVDVPNNKTLVDVPNSNNNPPSSNSLSSQQEQHPTTRPPISSDIIDLDESE